jgi:hypothetical protein
MFTTKQVMARLRARIRSKDNGFSLRRPVHFHSEFSAIKFMRKHLIGTSRIALVLFKCDNDLRHYMNGNRYFEVAKYKQHMLPGPGKKFIISFDKTRKV